MSWRTARSDAGRSFWRNLLAVMRDDPQRGKPRESQRAMAHASRPCMFRMAIHFLLILMTLQHERSMTVICQMMNRHAIVAMK
ncbi:hypothetical protein EZM97_29825 [Dyella soli]|uniref:Uncharacterized protein n=1 Tax=Dyella soli TaxID=522319 RepID=A0A4R0YI42_9GAMM|nr:hypothetical protein [Dyella soli]TCI06832.1 hypothetical protein EZM97_29825 [Dyella soli]